MPCTIPTYREIDVRVEIESCETFPAFDVASISKVTVVQVKNHACNMPDASACGFVERDGPSKIVLSTRFLYE
jgi:hypothetical protein